MLHLAGLVRALVRLARLAVAVGGGGGGWPHLQGASRRAAIELGRVLRAPGLASLQVRLPLPAREPLRGALGSRHRVGRQRPLWIWVGAGAGGWEDRVHARMAYICPSGARSRRPPARLQHPTK